MKKLNLLKLKCLFLLINISLFSFGQKTLKENYTSVDEITTTYYSTTNTIEKINALKSLSGIQSSKLKSATTDNQSQSIIISALSDKSPLIVEEAVTQIGKMNLNEYTNQLLSLYDSSRAKYGAYSERIQLAIIDAYAVIGGKNAEKLFARILDADNGSLYGENVLKAIQVLKSNNLLDEVIKYKIKMQEYYNNAKATESNALLYNNFKRCYELAELVENEL